MERLNQQEFRKRLIRHTQGGEAFVPMDELLTELKISDVGIVPEGVPYSIFQQFSHLCLAQRDIIDFSLNPSHQPLAWPEDYWPDDLAPENSEAWESLKDQYLEDRARWCDFILTTDQALTDPIPHGNGQTYLREALLIIEHTAYHTGEILVLMRLLGIR
ncbi:MAG: DinB family protein [Bacteroidota bacterium]